jgi:hypothetical protein
MSNTNRSRPDGSRSSTTAPPKQGGRSVPTPATRAIRQWATPAYNDLRRARVDMAKAAASIIMRRKLKGGGAAMQQLAQQALLQTGATPQTPVDPMAVGRASRCSMTR